MHESTLFYAGALWFVLAIIWLSLIRRLSSWRVTAREYFWPLIPGIVLGLAWVILPAREMGFVVLLAKIGVVLWAFLSVIWLVSVAKRDSSIMDVVYAFSLVLCAWVNWWLLGADRSPRSILTLAVVSLWGWRYTIHLAVRNLPRGEDPRYARWRARTGAQWWWWSYFQIFLLQGAMIWVWYVPIAFALLVPGPIGILEAIALLVWLVGFIFEAGADWQLARFRRDPANRGKVLSTGFWSQSRHPNYFGEATMWCAYGLLGLAHPWGWLGLVCNVYTVHMMNRGSATKMTDAYMKKRKPDYLAYAATTPIFLPRIFGGRPDREAVASPKVGT